MSGIGASVALALVLGWVIFAVAGFFLPSLPAVALGAVIGLVSVTLARDTVGVQGLIAVLAPFGVMLPALAARHMAVSLGVTVPGFSTIEIAVFLIVYVAFLCAAFGVIPVDLYRVGYAPLPVGAMVLAVCLYAFATGNWFLAGVAVLGQLFWVLGWGSSNWFDYMLHVVLVPVAVVVLIGRLIQGPW